MSVAKYNKEKNANVRQVWKDPRLTRGGGGKKGLTSTLFFKCVKCVQNGSIIPEMKRKFFTKFATTPSREGKIKLFLRSFSESSQKLKKIRLYFSTLACIPQCGIFHTFFSTLNPSLDLSFICHRLFGLKGSMTMSRLDHSIQQLEM